MLDRSTAGFTLGVFFCRLRAEGISAYGEEKNGGSEG